MNVSAEYIQAFVKQLDALDARTQQLIRREIEARNLEARIADGEADAYDELAEIMTRIVRSSSTMASALTVRYYNGIRLASDVDSEFEAETYDTVDNTEVKAATYSVGKEFASGLATVPLFMALGDTNSRYTRYASNETVRLNAAKDPEKPRYAIVPSATACVFCQMRAGLGYSYPTDASVDSHNHCKCQAVQVYGDSKIQGFDPSVYEKRYYDALHAYESGDISEDLEKRIEKARQRHNEKYKNGELTKPWQKTNAVLMVWREQEKERNG